jgi:hypothetical protein
MLTDENNKQHCEDIMRNIDLFCCHPHGIIGNIIEKYSL